MKPVIAAPVRLFRPLSEDAYDALRAAILGGRLEPGERIVEADIMEPEDQLYPMICSDVQSADEAYIKIPVQTKVAFPTVFDGERQGSW